MDRPAVMSPTKTPTGTPSQTPTFTPVTATPTFTATTDPHRNAPDVHTDVASDHHPDGHRHATPTPTSTRVPTTGRAR